MQATQTQTDPVATRRYTVHGITLAVSANRTEVLAGIHARLRHFSQPGTGAADLRFEITALPPGAKHCIARPPNPLRPVYNPPSGEVVYSDAKDHLYLSDGVGIKVLCDLPRGRVQASALTTEAERLWLLSHPLFTLPLVEQLKRRQRYHLHAAGLCLGNRGLLFPGNSGSGKSTLALALVRAGFGFLGDDTLFLEPTEAGPRVLAFPDEIDLTEQTIALFPELQPLLATPKTPGAIKRQLLVEAVYETELIRECQPAVLIFPRVAPAHHSVLTPLNPEQALLELAPNILLTESRAAQAHLDALAALVRQTPAYRLETGRDFTALAARLRALVA